MNSSLRLSMLLTITYGLLVSPLVTAAQDIRDLVQTATTASKTEALIDTQGIVYGTPFGTSEDEVIQKFGKPAGYIRLDAHRTALLYGKSHLLLCYDGSLDGILIERNAVNWEMSRWMTDSLPFTSEGWHLSNGVKSGMNLKAVKEIVKTEPESNTHRLTFSTDECLVQLGFSHRTDRGDVDEAYTVYSLLLARKHEGKDYWSEPPFIGRTIGQMLKGKKVIGINVNDSEKGVLVTTVYKDSPADKAGIHAGDLITGFNGESTVGMAAAEFSRRMGEQDVSKLEITSKDQTKRQVQVGRVEGSTLTSQLVGPRLTFSNVSVGDQAPDFEAKSADGTAEKLSDLKGSSVLIEFTNVGIEPCRKQTQALVAIEAKYKERGLKLLGVSLTPPSKDAFAGAKEIGADWPLHTDDKGWDNVVARTYGVMGVPSSVLVGKDGKILKMNGYDPDFENEIEEALK